MKVVREKTLRKSLNVRCNRGSILHPVDRPNQPTGLATRAREVLCRDVSLG